jgi:predicted neuraminidase
MTDSTSHGAPVFAPGSLFAQCHASTLARLPDGRFAAAFFAGTKEGHADTAIWLAVREGARWSIPRRLFKVSPEPHWNPVLFVDPEGGLHLWFKAGPDCAKWKTWHAVSADGGARWSAPEPVLHDAELPRGPVRNPPLVTSAGTWLAGASDELRPDAAGRTWWPFVDRSGDGGRTWAAVPVMMEPGAPAGKGGIQPALWESAPGRVHLFLRTGLGAIYRSDSADDARTWSPAYRTALPNNNSGIAVARLPDGRLALAWNPVGSDWGARTPLRLSLSADNGLTWTRHLDLATGPGEFSYPAIVAWADGLAATWTDRRTGIAFWTGSADRVPEGDLPRGALG